MNSVPARYTTNPALLDSFVRLLMSIAREVTAAGVQRAKVSTAVCLSSAKDHRGARSVCRMRQSSRNLRISLQWIAELGKRQGFSVSERARWAYGPFMLSPYVPGSLRQVNKPQHYVARMYACECLTQLEMSRRAAVRTL